MSSILVIQQNDRMFFGSDTAISAKIDNEIYRIDGSVKKIHVLNDKIIFCSGQLDIVFEIIKYISKNNPSIEEIRDVAKDYYQLLSNDSMIDILIGTIVDDKTVLYQISPYNNFEIIERKVNIGEIALWTGGIKTNKSLEKAYDLIKQKNTVIDIYQKTFEHISFEGIGGNLEIYSLDIFGISKINESKINENKSIKKLNIKPSNSQLIVAEQLIGQLLMGEKLIIGNADGTFTIDGSKLTIKDANAIIRTVLGEYETGKYGLLLKDKTGNQTILSEDGILQSYSDGRTDNLDENNPLILNVYIPSETISIKKALLRFKLLPFRAYSKGTASNPQQSTTSASATINLTTTQSGGSSSPTSLTSSDWHQWGIDVPDAVSSEGGHNHGIADGTALMKADGGTVWFYELYSHTHRLQSDHSHVVNIPSHSHGISMPSHSHSVTLPSHNHDIDYGIYTSTSASGVSCIINGIDRTTVLGGKFYGDRSGLDITPYLTIGQWNEIKLTSNQLGRIDATVFTQIFMGV